MDQTADDGGCAQYRRMRLLRLGLYAGRRDTADHRLRGPRDIRPAADPRTVAGEVIDVRTIGLSLLDAGDGTSVVLGWQRTIVAALRDNALVLGNPLTATGDTENDDNEKGVDNEN